MRTNALIVFRAIVFLSGLVAWLFAIILMFRGGLLWAGVCALFALGADGVGRVWSHNSPVPMPYFMRWMLLVPRGPHAPKQLTQILRPQSGERVLEIGPGVGVHALPIAASLLPNGVLDVLDVQREMLADLTRRAARKNLPNIVPTQGDAQRLPYADGTFDAAYLIGVLGEIPDTVAALQELRRVLRTSGRLVVSELVIDPDFMSLRALREKAGDAGFVFKRSSGPCWAYSALLQPASAPSLCSASAGRRFRSLFSY